MQEVIVDETPGVRQLRAVQGAPQGSTLAEPASPSTTATVHGFLSPLVASGRDCGSLLRWLTAAGHGIDGEHMLSRQKSAVTRQKSGEPFDYSAADPGRTRRR